MLVTFSRRVPPSEPQGRWPLSTVLWQLKVKCIKQRAGSESVTTADADSELTLCQVLWWPHYLIQKQTCKEGIASTLWYRERNWGSGNLACSGFYCSQVAEPDLSFWQLAQVHVLISALGCLSFLLLSLISVAQNHLCCCLIMDLGLILFTSPGPSSLLYKLAGWARRLYFLLSFTEKWWGAQTAVEAGHLGPPPDSSIPSQPCDLGQLDWSL